MKKIRATLFAATMIASVGLGGSATAAPTGATGWPTGCVNQIADISQTGAWKAKCSKGNGGHYKATIICYPLGGGPLVYHEPKAWVTSGWSKVYCPPFTYVKSGGILSKAS